MNKSNDIDTSNKRKGMPSENRYILFFVIFIIIILFIINVLATTTKEKLSLNFLDISIDSISQPVFEEVLAVLKGINTSANVADRFLSARAMVIGDSTVEGLEAYQALYATSVTWTRGRVIQYMEADLAKAISYQPDILILAYGANDLLSWNGNTTGYINAYDTVIKSLRDQFPNTTLGINEILPVSDTALSKNPAYAYREEFNTALKEFCKQNSITFIENSYLLDEATNGKKFESDGVHPKPFYYKLWANNMADTMNI